MKSFFQKKSTIMSVLVLAVLLVSFGIYKISSSGTSPTETLASEPKIASQINNETENEKLQDALNESQAESVRNCFPEYTTTFQEPFTAKDFVDIVLTDYKVDNTGSVQNEQAASAKKEFTFDLVKNGTKEGQVNYFTKESQVVEFNLQLGGKYLGCNETSCHCEN